MHCPVLHLLVTGLFALVENDDGGDGGDGGGDGKKLNSVKEGVKPDKSQGNKFLLGLIVGQLTFRHQTGRGEGTNACHPHMRY